MLVIQERQDFACGIYIKQEFGAIYHPNAVYKLLKSMGFSWITSRSRHPKQQTGVQDAYKKLPSGNDP